MGEWAYVNPMRDTRSAFRISAAGAFTDMLLLVDDHLPGERVFDGFTTGAAVAYVHQDPAGSLQTVALADSQQLALLPAAGPERQLKT